MSEFYEKTFKTYLSKDAFDKLAKRTCRAPFAINIEARDISEVPSSIISTIVFTTVEDRDRMTIAMRFADEERTTASQEAPASKSKTATRQTTRTTTNSGHYVAA